MSKVQAPQKQAPPTVGKQGSLPAQSGQKGAKQPKPKERYLTEDEIQELRETFDLFDDDKSGTIDATEISKVLEDLGLDQRNPIVFAMVQDLQNYQGVIDFETFVDIITERLGNNKTREGVEKLFALYDTNGDGFIDFQKLKLVAKELGETMNDDEIREMMHHIHVLKQTEDPDTINFDEFYAIVTAPKKY